MFWARGGLAAKLRCPGGQPAERAAARIAAILLVVIVPHDRKNETNFRPGKKRSQTAACMMSDFMMFEPTLCPELACLN